MACFYGKLNQAQLGDSAMSVYSLFVLMSLLGKPFGYSHFDTEEWVVEKNALSDFAAVKYSMSDLPG
ncbi:Hypp3783 [Branchiostoma lanceolatum]|uniref:Hypp3783 protein n=1 Tax=Branchiostoma lanceolatum TaxID=7740 RepID=A0A8K0A1Y7_BRALA|nr:Hypp3783 [Branchiostoma lanceolatum]